jgi:hypothetical protein
MGKQCLETSRYRPADYSGDADCRAGSCRTGRASPELEFHTAFQWNRFVTYGGNASKGRQFQWREAISLRYCIRNQ